MTTYGQKNEEFNISWDSFSTPGYNFDTNVNSEEVLNFQSFDGQYSSNTGGNYSYTGENLSYLDPVTSPQQDIYGAYPGFPTPVRSKDGQCDFEDDEPPLLEELGIFPDKIMGKTLMVLNPFHQQSVVDANVLCETDLAGPAAFCVILGMCLLLAGAKAHFGYVYGLVVISCILMYILLSLMTTRGNVTFGSVASILGYCLLPITVLSVCSIFVPLYSPLGFIVSLFAVLWSSFSASKLFVILSAGKEQRPLIAYPCALLYGTFALIIVF